MSKIRGSVIDKEWIISQRGKKNIVDPRRPYAWLVEKERTASGKIEDTAIIFLTNRECPFYCLMCDLWKNTTDKFVPAGAIPEQIEWALDQMPKTKHLKLYNSGSFFDEKAIPEADYPKIASLINHFETVIVESHPKLINEKCLRFKEMLKPELEIAIGLETSHPEILKLLHKQMTLNDFSNAVGFLSKNKIRTRTFILLKPPFLSEEEGIYWAKCSVDFAFDSGVECCTIIPVRPGNGAMDWLHESGDFSLPKISSLENVLEYGIKLRRGRVFADTWDLQFFSDCDKCFGQRINRLNTINHSQQLSDRILCSCSGSEINNHR